MKKKLIFLSITLALFSSTAHADLIIKKDETKTIQIINGKEVVIEKSVEAKDESETTELVEQETKQIPPYTGNDRPDWRKWNSSQSKTLYQSTPESTPIKPVVEVEVKTSVEKSEIKVEQTKEISPVIAKDENKSNSDFNFQRVSSDGVRPVNIDKAGWGSEVSGHVAVMQVIPDDFEVSHENIGDKLVSWEGNKEWDLALESLAEQGNFFAHINWSEKTVLVVGVSEETAVPSVVKKQDKPVFESTYEKPKQTTISTVVKMSEIDGRQDVKGGQVDVEIHAPLRQMEPNSWYLDPQFTLSENITRWGEKAGWTVVWNGADYPIVSRAYFTGSFASPEGPLAQIMRAYERSDQPLVANLTTIDKVVHIRNKIHERAHVVPSTPFDFNPQAQD